MKKLILITLMLLGVWAYPQQDPMYTQYMFNPLAVNPAYAGSKDAVSFLGLFRGQWLGLDGAPITQTLTIHGPLLDKNMGLGLSIVNDKIGAVNQTLFFGDYSYRIRVGGEGNLQFGIKAGLSMFSAKLSGLRNKVESDPSVFDYSGKLLPNVGVGVFYYSEQAYFGVSVPKLLKNFVKEKISNEEIKIGTIRRHLFIMGGYVFYLNPTTKFKPSFMMRMVNGAPVSIDLAGMFYFQDKLGLGLAMRREATFSALINYYFSPSFYIGYAYDYTRTELRDFSNGTHEFMLGYDLQLVNTHKIYSPRFF